MIIEISEKESFSLATALLFFAHSKESNLVDWSILIPFMQRLREEVELFNATSKG